MSPERLSSDELRFPNLERALSFNAEGIWIYSRFADFISSYYDPESPIDEDEIRTNLLLDIRAIIDFAENKHSADFGELLRRGDFKITKEFRTVLKSFDNMPVKALAKLTEVWKDSSPPRTQYRLQEALVQKQQERFNPGGQKYR